MHISPPHIHGGDSIGAHMSAVMLALLPATLMSVWLFGWLAVFLLTTCIVSCMLTEFLCLRWMGKPSLAVWDGSAALTGLFLALILPATAPWWAAIIASIFAIALGKQAFGGLGYNPFNPALSARIVLLISFPLYMTAWLIPWSGIANVYLDIHSFSACIQIFLYGIPSINYDALTMATPLGHVQTSWTQGIGFSAAMQNYPYSIMQAFLGFESGSLGETSALALLLGGGYLLWRGIISWHIPISCLLSVIVLATIFHYGVDSEHFAPPLFHLFAGGLVLCAFFMATDPVTSPVTPMGKIVFGIGCGILIWVIRTWGTYPEGAMFAVVLMNCATPLLDRYLRPKVYGT
ncbi:MAG: RnfABCDGE type electron transport complex subunit D [Mariprofundales bacterium]